MDFIQQEYHHRSISIGWNSTGSSLPPCYFVQSHNITPLNLPSSSPTHSSALSLLRPFKNSCSTCRTGLIGRPPRKLATKALSSVMLPRPATVATHNVAQGSPHWVRVHTVRTIDITDEESASACISMHILRAREAHRSSSEALSNISGSLRLKATC